MSQYVVCLLGLLELLRLTLDLFAEQFIHHVQIYVETGHVFFRIDLEEAFVFVRVVRLRQDPVNHALTALIELLTQTVNLSTQVNHGIKALLRAIADANMGVLFRALVELTFLVLRD